MWLDVVGEWPKIGPLLYLLFPPTQSQKGTPLLTLMKDPYILIAAGKKKKTAAH